MASDWLRWEIRWINWIRDDCDCLKDEGIGEEIARAYFDH
jgi:hypothetical protein